MTRKALAYADEMADTAAQIAEAAAKDIYTDAPECSQQVEYLRNLVAHLQLLSKAYQHLSEKTP
jgi:hypothetical protein